jgi:glycosyltransferase involved in cell wall biosynthesis
MKNLPKVAILSVFYNRENFVWDSVTSLLVQTYQNLEIILVDDNSKDNTFQLIKNLTIGDDRVRCIRNSINKGFTQTLIDTIQDLDAEYIAIHGSGDISIESRISVQVEYLLNNPNVGVVTTDLVNSTAIVYDGTRITTTDLLEKNRITHGAVMFRMECYRLVGGYRSFFHTRQDKDLWFRMSLITDIHFIPKKLYKLVPMGDSVSQNGSNTGLQTLLSSFASFLISERIRFGYDSLDKYGPHSALYFNPAISNKLFWRNARKSLFSRKWNAVVSYLEIMRKINVNGFLLAILSLLIFFLKWLKK